MRRIKFLIIFLISSVTLLGFGLYLNIKSKEKIVDKLANLQVGESIDEMILITENGTKVNKYKMNTYEMAVIFIFSWPCSPCNKNIPFWQRIGSLKKADIFGIVIEDAKKMTSFAESMNLNFHLFCPLDINKFKQDFRLKFDLAQTLLLKKGKIIYVNVGELTPQDYFEITKKLNKGGI